MLSIPLSCAAGSTISNNSIALLVLLINESITISINIMTNSTLSSISIGSRGSQCGFESQLYYLLAV